MADDVLQEAIALAKESGMNEFFDDESTVEEPSGEVDEKEDEESAEDVSGDEETENADDESDSDDSDDSEDDSEDDEPQEDEDKKVIKVKVGDNEEEITLGELKSSYMRNSDYTNKTKKLAEERAQTERQRAVYEESKAGYEKVLEEASKILPSLVYRESDKLSEALRKINVESLTPEQMTEYTRLRAYRDQLVEQETERDAKYRALVDKQRKLEQEAMDRQWASDQPVIEATIPDYKDPVKREKLNTELSKYLVDTYGENKARSIAQTVRTKEDYLTIYYAYVGKKYLETGKPEKIVEKKKNIKSTNQAGKQSIASAKVNSTKKYDQIMERGRKRGRLTDEEAIALLTMKGI